MQTKYDVGGTALVKVHIERIEIPSDGKPLYHARVPSTSPAMFWFGEAVFEETDYISADKYEAEINDLKDEINRLREMYQLEHLKALKLKNESCRGMDSHHPSPNIYADDWRMP